MKTPASRRSFKRLRRGRPENARTLSIAAVGGENLATSSVASSQRLLLGGPVALAGGIAQAAAVENGDMATGVPD